MRDGPRSDRDRSSPFFDAVVLCTIGCHSVDSDQSQRCSADDMVSTSRDLQVASPPRIQSSPSSHHAPHHASSTRHTPPHGYSYPAAPRPPRPVTSESSPPSLNTPQWTLPPPTARPSPTSPPSSSPTATSPVLSSSTRPLRTQRRAEGRKTSQQLKSRNVYGRCSLLVSPPLNPSRN